MRIIIPLILLLGIIISACAPVPVIPRNDTNPVPDAEIYWVEIDRPCSTIPETTISGKAQFCESFCVASLQNRYAEYKCKDANPGMDMINCGCYKEDDYLLSWKLTYECESEETDTEKCQNQCTSMGLAYKNNLCDENRIRCECTYRQS
ncbi:hypothetical protein JW968_05810 [Candidatus Woesearchaeota archaeon]|nr:hypothetical protein [Candidatus Woesearchaeota archaeon]